MPVVLRIVAVCALLATGCGRLGFGVISGDGDGDGDGDGGITEVPFPPSNGVDGSDLDGVTSDLTIVGSTTLNSDTGQIFEDGVEIRPAGIGVIKGLRFETISSTIGLLSLGSLDVEASGTLRIFGDRALVILAADAILVSGLVDASAGVCSDGSASSSCAGPGGGAGSLIGSAGGCAPGGDGGGGGDTGGGGGGFGEDGARGGNETDETLSPGGAAGVAGVAVCVGETLEPLAGGSGGGRGGCSPFGGGGGGGALQLTAFVTIEINDTGAINVGGAGGTAGNGDGGGGGGSGGALLIESPHVDLNDGILAANGGGGGEGNGAADGQAGQPSDQAATGGFSGDVRGGDGGSLLSPPIAGGDDVADTGGGGGGVGRIRINTDDLRVGTPIVSPAASTSSL